MSNNVAHYNVPIPKRPFSVDLLHADGKPNPHMMRQFCPSTPSNLKQDFGFRSRENPVSDDRSLYVGTCALSVLCRFPKMLVCFRADIVSGRHGLGTGLWCFVRSTTRLGFYYFQDTVRRLLLIDTVGPFLALINFFRTTGSFAASKASASSQR